MYHVKSINSGVEVDFSQDFVANNHMAIALAVINASTSTLLYGEYASVGDIGMSAPTNGAKLRIIY